uniref:Uncharacterized protein n=1 Tax=Amorphochlora amoebiformis TaxID=1561963 RepID=A0A0H5BI24_9EUKA|nr:hypothetical protein [Amorphochlora amoebiformis]
MGILAPKKVLEYNFVFKVSQIISLENLKEVLMSCSSFGSINIISIKKKKSLFEGVFKNCSFSCLSYNPLINYTGFGSTKGILTLFKLYPGVSQIKLKKIMKFSTKKPIKCTKFLLNTTELVIGGSNLKILDYNQKRITKIIKTNSASISKIQTCKDGLIIYNNENRLYIYNLYHSKLICELVFLYRISNFTIMKKEHDSIYSSFCTNFILENSLNSFSKPTKIIYFNNRHKINNFDISKNNNLIVSINYKYVKIINLLDNSFTGRLKLPGYITSIFSLDNNKFACLTLSNILYAYEHNAEAH